MMTPKTTSMDRKKAAIQAVARNILARQNPAVEPDLLRFMREQFFIPEGTGRLIPAPYQEVVLREAHRRNERGELKYKVVVWSDIKKSIKSTIAAAVMLHRALHTPSGSFKVVANDLQQADSRVFYYLRRAIALNPVLGKLASVRNYKVTLANGAIIQAVPVDPKGEAGGNDDFIEFTELHAASSKAAVKMWAEMTIPPAKHAHGQRWIDTYAGHVGESPILEMLYNQVVSPANLVQCEVEGLQLYARDDILMLWNTVPRMAWQTPEYYASEARVLPPSEFRRIHRNEWVTSENTFIPPEWWTQCRSELPPLQSDEGVVIGIDAGVTNDCFAIVGVSRRGEMTYVRFARVWRPNGNALDFAEPEAFLRRIAQQFKVVCFVYDPYQLHDLATRLRRDGVGWFKVFLQGQERLMADKLLYDCIRDRRIVHDGNEVLTEHVLNANQKADGERLRLVKRAEHLKIDAAVALSMANSEARRLYVG